MGGDHSGYEAWRAAVWDKHGGRSGFRLARAYAADVLVGFAYGYTGEHGQWWTDNPLKVLDPDIAEAWLGGHFELVSIGVLDVARHGGIGRRLLQILLEGLPHERLLLMTSSDPSGPARRLYASEGWHVLGPGQAMGRWSWAGAPQIRRPRWDPPSDLGQDCIVRTPTRASSFRSSLAGRSCGPYNRTYVRVLGR